MLPAANAVANLQHSDDPALLVMALQEALAGSQLILDLALHDSKTPSSVSYLFHKSSSNLSFSTLAGSLILESTGD